MFGFGKRKEIGILAEELAAQLRHLLRCSAAEDFSDFAAARVREGFLETYRSEFRKRSELFDYK